MEKEEGRQKKEKEIEEVDRKKSMKKSKRRGKMGSWLTFPQMASAGP